MEGLPKDLQDIVWDYKHHLEFSPTLRTIEQIFAKHKAEVDLYVVDAWEEWNLLQNPKMFMPGRYAPGGTRHHEYLWTWFKFKRKVRYSTREYLHL